MINASYNICSGVKDDMYKHQSSLSIFDSKNILVKASTLGKRVKKDSQYKTAHTMGILRYNIA